MTEKKDYLSKELERFQEIIKEKLAVHKNELQSRTNDVLLQHITLAEEKIKEAKVFHTNEYEQRMKALEIREIANPSFTQAKRLSEEFFERQFKRGMEYSIDTWVDYVNSCKIQTMQTN